MLPDPSKSALLAVRPCFSCLVEQNLVLYTRFPEQSAEETLGEVEEA